MIGLDPGAHRRGPALLPGARDPAGLSPVEAAGGRCQSGGRAQEDHSRLRPRPRRRHRPAARPRQPGDRAARDHHGDGQLDAGQRHAQRARRRDASRASATSRSPRAAPRPLVGELSTAHTIHGSTGLDGPVLPAPTRTLDPRHAVDVIIETVLREEPGTVTLVPTAALTNVALAVRKEPRIADRVAEVVLMGGAVTGGNWSAAAEFNIVTDPEAAHIVFGARLAGDDGRARSHAPGPRHPGRRRPHRRARHPTGPVRHRGAGVLRHDLPRRAGLPAPAGARPVRGRPRDRPRGAHDPAGAGRRWSWPGATRAA